MFQSPNQVENLFPRDKTHKHNIIVIIMEA